MKIIKFALILLSLFCLANSVTFSSKTKSLRMQAAEEVLNSLKDFNNKYSNINRNKF
jgi:hypothetical protein